MAFLVRNKPPCVLYEDDHLLAVNKPAGVNTHAPNAFSEGIYDWLRHRQPDWSRLAIIQRLDKETSGLLLFSKSTLANRSLTEQFTRRRVRKRYILQTVTPPGTETVRAVSKLVRAGSKYVSQPLCSISGEEAETRFKSLGPAGPFTRIEAFPLTGKTHQIRVHAAAGGFPILGDVLYGGSPAPRVYLHAEELRFKHPETGREMTLRAPVDFASDPAELLRRAFIRLGETNACRLLHGRSDHPSGLYLDRLGDFLLAQSEQEPTREQLRTISARLGRLSLKTAYHKVLVRSPGTRLPPERSPRLLFGPPAPPEFVVRENGVQFLLSFDEGYSTGLFLDQRDNRRRLLTRHVAADFPLFPDPSGRPEVLNAFAYTCAFSVCAAQPGARVTSLDLSKKYLDWGKRNFALNGLDPADHDFIYGDAFDWMRRLTKKGRSFDAIILDPPTFSRSKEQGVFQVEKDYSKLVQTALPLLKPDGFLLACTNSASLKPDKFIDLVRAPILSSGRRIERQHFFPQPPDFPISRSEPAYLKTVWLRVG